MMGKKKIYEIPFTVDEVADVLSECYNLDVDVVELETGVDVIQVNSAITREMMDLVAEDIGGTAVWQNGNIARGRILVDEDSEDGFFTVDIGHSANEKRPISSVIWESRKYDMWDTIAWCAENHKCVWLKYETVDGDIISRKVAPYSYRTKNTKVRGKQTYFYAQDFTPGKDHTIKCFLIDNCLQAKRSIQSFSPRFDVEIRQEIDELERQREERRLKRERDKRRREQKRKEREKMKKQNAEKKPTDAEPAKKVEPTKVEPTKVEPTKVEPTKVEPTKKAEPTKAKPDKKQLVTTVQKGRTDTKKKPVDDEPKKPLPPPTEQQADNENPESSKSDSENVTVTSQPDDEGLNKPKNDGEIQVTDADGNLVKESGEDDENLHGRCHKWAWDNWQEGDSFFVLTEWDDELEQEALMHCGLIRNGVFMDAQVQSTNIDDILDNFDYGDFDFQAMGRDEFSDFCVDFGLPL